jgi:hypothetical protein
MKFAGLFHRGKRTPQRFMMRLKVRNSPRLGPQAPHGSKYATPWLSCCLLALVTSLSGHILSCMIHACDSWSGQTGIRCQHWCTHVKV